MMDTLTPAQYAYILAIVRDREKRPIMFPRMWSEQERRIDADISSYGQARVAVDADAHEDEAEMMAPPGATFVGFEDEGELRIALFERND